MEDKHRREERWTVREKDAKNCLKKPKPLATVLERINTIRELAEFISLLKTCLGTSTANKLKLVQINNHLPPTSSWEHKKRPRSVSLAWQRFRNQQQTMDYFPKCFSYCAERTRSSSKTGALCSFLAIESSNF